MLVWNRALWLAVAAVVLMLLHRRFRFAHAGVQWPPEQGTASAIGAERRSGPGRWRSRASPASFGFRTTVRQTLAVARRSLAEVVASRWFVVVLLGCHGPHPALGLERGRHRLRHVDVAGHAPRRRDGPVRRISPFISLLIAVYAGELVWKERDVGVAEIADAAPVPEGVALLGRFLALVAMLAMFQAAFMAGGILLQALQGYYRFELGLYLRILFGLNLADYVLLAALAMTIHVLVNHKYLGHIVVLMAFVSTRGLARCSGSSGTTCCSTARIRAGRTRT